MKEKSIAIITVIGIVLLLLEAGGLYYTATQTDYFVGAQGPRGEQGATGATGAQGIQGPFGPQGQPGQRGISGPAGASGSDGRDAPINIPPTITLVNISGYHHCYKFNLTVLVEDEDDTNLSITFYYALVEGNWIYHSKQYGFGNFTVHYKTTDINTIHWLVEVWDGQDITYGEYEYTVLQEG